MKKPELLVPASCLEVLKVAVIYGADAIYIGGPSFGLRANAKNFTEEDLKSGINFAHEHNVKVYVTVNITAHNDDLSGIEEYLKYLNKIKPDALIISDPGVFTLAKKITPDIDIHISTQANNTNYETFKFWYDMGAKRVVAARELSLEEITTIKKNVKEKEIEVFIHGAMCISYSGRCLLSNFLAGRDANLGECTHPCRWKYYLVEETRPGEYMPINEDDKGTYIFNSKDLCMIEYIPQLIESGIDSFKIEGRMKTALYVATVARTYRKAIDDYFESKDLYLKNMPWYKEQIANCTYRKFTTGFFFGKPNEESQIYDNNTYTQNAVYLGMINDQRYENMYGINQRNKFSIGEEVEIMKPNGQNIKVNVLNILNEKHEQVESAPHPDELLYIDLGVKLEEYYIIRKKA